MDKEILDEITKLNGKLDKLAEAIDKLTQVESYNTNLVVQFLQSAKFALDAKETIANLKQKLSSEEGIEQQTSQKDEAPEQKALSFRDFYKKCYVDDVDIINAVGKTIKFRSAFIPTGLKTELEKAPLSEKLQKMSEQKQLEMHAITAHKLILDDYAKIEKMSDAELSAEQKRSKVLYNKLSERWNKYKNDIAIDNINKHDNIFD